MHHHRLLVCVLIWLMIVPTYAQESEGTWESGCDAAAEVVIAPIMGKDLYSAACDALTTCIEQTAIPPMGCEFPVYDALMSLCEGDDCDLQSRFYTASLLIFEQLTTSSFVYHADAMQATIAETLLAFQSGDYQAIIDTYAQNPANPVIDLNRSPFQDFIVGLMYETLGDPEKAAAAYRASIELLRMPFVTAQRAQIMAQLGFADAAGAEAVMIGDYPAGEAIRTRYPLPETLIETWNIYPTDFGWAYPSDRDLTTIPGTPFQMAFLSDGSVLTIGVIDTPPSFHFRETLGRLADRTALLFYPGDEEYILRDDLTSTTAWLRFQDAVGSLSVYSEGIMRSQHMEALLAPTDAPDPREEQYERCEEGARWRLSVDGYGAAMGNGKGVEYYNAPGGELAGAFTFELSAFRVVDGPVCLDGQSWWEIDLMQVNGETYWLPEAQAPASEYYAQSFGLFYYVRPTAQP